MWIFFLGPFLSLLPTRWRKSLPFYQAVHWHSASILSGLAESVIALTALLYWYSYSVTTWVSRALDSALSRSAPTGLSVNDVGFAALVVWATHPLTWTLAFFGVEGIARLCAGFTDTVLGVFPLYLVEKTYSKIFRRGAAEPAGTVKFSQSHVSSYVDTVKGKVLTARLSQIPDELCVAKNAAEEILEIRAWCAKLDWTPPRVVRYEDRYYRLEECARGPAPRPFVYKLRRLAVGVPGRTVLIYSPDEAPVTADR
ncbi:MAG TPA: hypothetical protein VJW94_01675 [Candidatus Acidoferrum sp.]|nr:hypothetical protein [Candidatus Acidoferrum sp.]